MRGLRQITDTGRIRPINEDSFYLPRAGERFCAVADGMGGHNAGEVASALAVETFAGAMRASGQPGQAGALTRRSAAPTRPCSPNRSATTAKSGMGTTFTALSEDGRLACNIAHVGDSRAYRIRNGAIMRLTTDHTLVEEMVAQRHHHRARGAGAPASATTSRARWARRGAWRSTCCELNLRAGDVFLLCTDGLSNHVDEREMLEVDARAPRHGTRSSPALVNARRWPPAARTTSRRCTSIFEEALP